MSTTDIILIIMGAVIAALLFVVFKNSGRLADSVPQPIVVLLLNMLLSLLKDWGKSAAAGTKTSLDDEAVTQAITLIESFLSLYGKNAPASPGEGVEVAPEGKVIDPPGVISL